MNYGTDGFGEQSLADHWNARNGSEESGAGSGGEEEQKSGGEEEQKSGDENLVTEDDIWNALRGHFKSIFGLSQTELGSEANGIKS